MSKGFFATSEPIHVHLYGGEKRSFPWYLGPTFCPVYWFKLSFTTADLILFHFMHCAELIGYERMCVACKLCICVGCSSPHIHVVWLYTHSSISGIVFFIYVSMWKSKLMICTLKFLMKECFWLQSVYGTILWENWYV